MKVLMVEGREHSYSELVECLRKNHYEVELRSLKPEEIQELVQSKESLYNYIVLEMPYEWAEEESKKATYCCGDLEMNVVKQTVTRAGQEISLTNCEFQLLEYLMQNQNKFVSREEIARKVWQEEGTSTNVVDVYIYYLRNKIDDGFEKKLLRTMRGVGYCLAEDDGIGQITRKGENHN